MPACFSVLLTYTKLTHNVFDVCQRIRQIFQRTELFRELRRKTVRALRVDKEAYVRGICEGGRASPVVK